MTERVLVTGGTGFVGAGLLPELDSPVVLTRDPDSARSRLGDVTAHPWDALEAPPPPEAFDGVDVIYHLAGTSVAEKRWNSEVKKQIRDSRVQGTRYLVSALEELSVRPRVLVSASAIGYYGNRGDEELTEESAPGKGFLADVCREWEAEAHRAEDLGVRVVCVRFGIVLEEDGGALEQMLPIFRKGAGGRVGSGKQWMSWIHRQDLVRLLLHCASQSDLRGAVNGTAPEPVINREFARVLGEVLERPAVLPVPGFMLRVALGEVAQEITGSLRVLPAVAERTGFEFTFPELGAALRDILD